MGKTESTPHIHDPSEDLRKELARQQTRITKLESELADALKFACSTVKEPSPERIVEVPGPERIVYTEKIVEKIVEVPVERIFEKIVHVNVDRVVEAHATTASEDITYELKQLRSKYNEMQALYEAARKERDTTVAQSQSVSSAADLVKDELQLKTSEVERLEKELLELLRSQELETREHHLMLEEDEAEYVTNGVTVHRGLQPRPQKPKKVR